MKNYNSFLGIYFKLILIFLLLSTFTFLKANSTVIFDSLEVSQTQEKTIQLSNSGDLLLEISNITIVSGSDNFNLNAQNSYVINSNETININVDFIPQSVGSYSGRIAIESNSSDSEVKYIDLEAVCYEIKEPKIKTRDSLQFVTNTIDSTITKNFYIKNSGGTTLEVTNLSLDKESTAFTINSNMNFSIVSGDSSQIKVQYTPQNWDTLSNRIIVESNATNDPTAYVNLSAQASQLPEPQIESKDSIKLVSNTIDTTITNRLKVSNYGDTTLNLSSISLETQSNYFSVVNENMSIPKGEYKYIDIQYSPQRWDTITNRLIIESNASNKPKKYIKLKGLCYELPEPKIEVQQDSLKFTSHKIDTNITQQINIANVGDATLSISDLRLSNSDSIFNLNISGSISIFPGDNKYLEIDYSPSDWDTTYNTFIIENNAENDSRVKVELKGMCSELPKPKIQVKDTLEIVTLEQDTAITTNLKIENTGNSSSTLELDKAYLKNADSDLQIINPENISLDPEESDYLTIQYTPDSYEKYSNKLIIESNAISDSVKSIDIEGRCGERPKLIIKIK